MGDFTKEDYLELREKYITILEGHSHEIKSLKHRVLSVENMTKEIQGINVNLTLMIQKMDNHQRELEEQKAKIDKLEDIPQMRWNTVITALITTIIGVIIGLAFK